MPETLFISDLHLDKERPHIIELFSKFMRDQASKADALYILGDLFEYWIGDDAPDEGAARVITILKAATDAGLSIYFIHGNRDFLIGNTFAAQTGCRLLPEAAVIDLYGKPTLIMHGDTLCTDDIPYQKLRKKTHNKLLQKLLLMMTVKMRQSLARYLRKKSAEAINAKSDNIMDVNQQAVIETLNKYGVKQLIHGHTHRPAKHDLSINEEPAERIVLGDWYEQGSVLRCTVDDCKLTTLQL